MAGSELGDTHATCPEPPPGTPLYVHLPFCAAKCHYCDFFSVAAEGHDVDGWLGALLTEIDRRAPVRPRTVFLGGGTPSLLSASQWTRLLDALERRTGFRGSASEVTAECNPESLDRDKARCLLDLGVRRVSIGFQSLRPEVLELFGRVHSVDQSFRAYEAAREAGFADVNVDLIYAVPGQDPGDWSGDLARVLALRPDHVSAYNLAFEEGTPFRRWMEEGKLARLPEETELELLELTRRLLADGGWERYEISNYAATDRQCQHNVNYWRNGDYLGVGPSAVSKVGTTRAGNVRSIGEYARRIAAGSSALAWSERPAWSTRLGETWWLGLRLLEGLSAHEARTRAGADLASEEVDPAEAVAERHTAGGWLERAADDRWRLTERGLPVADAIAREFLRLPPGDLTTGERGATPVESSSSRPLG